MISAAILIGIYAYSIFFLGIAKVLTSFTIGIVTIVFVSILLALFLKKRRDFSFSFQQFDTTNLIVLLILLLQAVFNLIGALGPEYSFDALWYHLMLPKLYLTHHAIYHVPGGLLYYSDMPKLGEMLFVAALTFHTEILAKLIQFSFGVLISVLIYQTSRKYFSYFISLLVVLLFYGNLVVAWESTVAYIDLIRTFYEFFSLLIFLTWVKESKDRYLYLSGVILGFAICTKLLSLSSLVILSGMVLFFVGKQRKEIAIKKMIYFLFSALIIPLPWFVFSFINTHNPVYPFFTPLYPTHVSWTLLHPFIFFRDIVQIFTQAADPISPVYLVVLPFLLFYPSFRKEIKIIAIYSLGSIILWYITPRTGGGRFMLPYLPGFSLIVGEILFILSKDKKYNFYRIAITGMIICISVSTLIYRGVASAKYFPYLLGKESKQSFLVNHLNFSFGDFLDIDGKIQKMLLPTDVVLLIGFHNLYYVDFPFIDMSYIRNGDRFTYIATQYASLPLNYTNAQKVYEEKKTGVVLYRVGEETWKSE